jgi:Ca-activated chloride channel family protein
MLLGCLIALLAGPQQLKMPEAERELKNIQFCIDMSGSMVATFSDSTRYEHTLKAVNDFCTYRRQGAFGLTVFGNEVIHWVPVTRDLSAIRNLTPLISPRIFPGAFGGTMIGKALRKVLAKMEDVTDGDRMIILISDGESSDLHGGNAEAIGAELAGQKITLFYIHVGEGQPQSEVNTMVTLSGGESFVAGDAESLKGVFQRIDAMSPARLKPGSPEPVDYFQPIVLGGLLALGLWILAGGRLRFTPW